MKKSRTKHFHDWFHDWYHDWFHEKMTHIFEHEYKHEHFVTLANEIYENGFSCLDVMNWLSESPLLEPETLASAQICFQKIKSEYRSEQLLMLYLFDYIFLRSNKDIKSISSI